MHVTSTDVGFSVELRRWEMMACKRWKVAAVPTLRPADTDQ